MPADLRLKIAYYGAGLGGKSTNLRVLAKAAGPTARLWTEKKETTSPMGGFDLLVQLELPSRSGPRVHVVLHTEPG